MPRLTRPKYDTPVNMSPIGHYVDDIWGAKWTNLDGIALKTTILYLLTAATRYAFKTEIKSRVRIKNSQIFGGKTSAFVSGLLQFRANEANHLDSCKSFVREHAPLSI